MSHSVGRRAAFAFRRAVSAAVPTQFISGGVRVPSSSGLRATAAAATHNTIGDATSSTSAASAAGRVRLLQHPAAGSIFAAPHQRRSIACSAAASDEAPGHGSAATAIASAAGDAEERPFAELPLHPSVVTALAALGFNAGTGIQSRAIPLVARGGDVVIAAETGSGKTLTYLAPVFSNLLNQADAAGGYTAGRLGALIMCPNATLCEQVTRVANSLVGEDGKPLLRTTMLTPDTALPNTLPDIVVATPARAVEDVLGFSDGAWRRGNFAPGATHIRHVVFDEADMLLSGGYLRAVRGCFDVLYREEKLAAQGLSKPMDSAEGAGAGEGGGDEWAGDEGRGEVAYEQDWRKDHEEDVRVKVDRSAGPALGGKGGVGKGEGRQFRRQYIFAAATVMSNGKKTPGAMIKYGFPDAEWVSGRRLHQAVSSVKQEWEEVTMENRADALGRALALGSDGKAGPGAGERTMVFVNSSAACEAVTSELCRQGLAATAFHAEVEPRERSSRLTQLASGEVTVLVCTDSAARGIDVPEIAHVIQAEFAGNAVDYLHRIGRTARAGATGRVTNLYLSGSIELVTAVRQAEGMGEPVENAFSRKRSFRKKYKKYGPSRTAPQNR